MRKKDGKDELFTPEFLDWLKEKQITRKRLKKDPTALDMYHREWMKTKKGNRPKKLSLLQNLPSINFDLGKVIENVRIAGELLKAYQESKESHSPNS